MFSFSPDTTGRFLMVTLILFLATSLAYRSFQASGGIWALQLEPTLHLWQRSVLNPLLQAEGQTALQRHWIFSLLCHSGNSRLAFFFWYGFMIDRLVGFCLRHFSKQCKSDWFYGSSFVDQIWPFVKLLLYFGNLRGVHIIKNDL